MLLSLDQQSYSEGRDGEILAGVEVEGSRLVVELRKGLRDLLGHGLDWGVVGDEFFGERGELVTLCLLDVQLLVEGPVPSVDLLLVLFIPREPGKIYMNELVSEAERILTVEADFGDGLLDLLPLD